MGETGNSNYKSGKFWWRCKQECPSACLESYTRWTIILRLELWRSSKCIWHSLCSHCSTLISRNCLRLNQIVCNLDVILNPEVSFRLQVLPSLGLPWPCLACSLSLLSVDSTHNPRSASCALSFVNWKLFKTCVHSECSFVTLNFHCSIKFSSCPCLGYQTSPKFFSIARSVITSSPVALLDISTYPF